MIERIKVIKDKSNNYISNIFEYEYDKNDYKTKVGCFWIILNNEMNNILKNDKENQFFFDINLLYINISYKLFVTSAYNFIKKYKTYCFISTPNE